MTDPGFRRLLQYGATGRVWVKLSAAYRMAGGGPGDDFAVAAAAELKQHFGPGRLLWGSDWPHTQHEHAAWLSYGAVAAQLARILPEEADRDAAAWRNPARLFRIPQAR